MFYKVSIAVMFLIFHVEVTVAQDTGPSFSSLEWACNFESDDCNVLYGTPERPWMIINQGDTRNRIIEADFGSSSREQTSTFRLPYESTSSSSGTLSFHNYVREGRLLVEICAGSSQQVFTRTMTSGSESVESVDYACDSPSDVEITFTAIGDSRARIAVDDIQLFVTKDTTLQGSSTVDSTTITTATIATTSTTATMATTSSMDSSLPGGGDVMLVVVIPLATTLFVLAVGCIVVFIRSRCRKRTKGQIGLSSRCDHPGVTSFGQPVTIPMTSVHMTTGRTKGMTIATTTGTTIGTTAGDEKSYEPLTDRPASHGYTELKDLPKDDGYNAVVIDEDTAYEVPLPPPGLGSADEEGRDTPEYAEPHERNYGLMASVTAKGNSGYDYAIDLERAEEENKPQRYRNIFNVRGRAEVLGLAVK